MSYTTPTPATFKASYPEFAATGDPVVQEALDKAGLVVDNTWSEGAYSVAYKLYAAHVLRLGGQGNSGQAALAAEMPFGVKRRRAGDTEMEVFAGGGNGSAATGSAAWYERTPFGQEFKLMQRREFAGPRVYPSPIQAPTTPPFTP